MNTLEIGKDEEELMLLRDKMSDQQRNDMAEIIGNELKRRESLKINSMNKSNIKSSPLSGGLNAEDLAEVYQNSGKNIQQLRVKALENKVLEAKRDANRINSYVGSVKSSFNIPNLSSVGNKIPVILLGIAILFLGGIKTIRNVKTEDTKNIISSNQTASRASMKDELKEINNKYGDVSKEEESSNKVGSKSSTINFNFSQIDNPIEKSLLMQLDQRRLELERRNSLLDKKEDELKKQSKLISQKVVELKSLTNKLAALRSEKDSRYDSRLDQLASVYTAMAPQDASNLIAKLDSKVALGLLERMPEKRMAQILGVMDQSRALDLTKLLTDRK